MTLRGSGFQGLCVHTGLSSIRSCYIGAPYRVDLYDKCPPRGTVRRSRGVPHTCFLKLTDCRVVSLSILQVLDNSCIPFIVPSYCYPSGTVAMNFLRGPYRSVGPHFALGLRYCAQHFVHWAPTELLHLDRKLHTLQ